MSEGPKVPDRAVIKTANKRLELQIGEFLALELSAQVNHLFRGEVEFFLGGEKLRTTEALKALRAQRAQANQVAAGIAR